MAATPKNVPWENLDSEFESSRRVEAFCKWFWTGNNFKYCIDKLNWESPYELKIRIEKNPPIIYCIAIKIPGNDGAARLCKIGLTLADISGPKNRLKNVMDKIPKDYQKEEPPEVFKLPVAATNTSPLLDTEAEVREKFGIKVNEELARELSLPNITEWVLTSSDYICWIKRLTDSRKATTDEVTNERNTFRFFLNQCNQGITELFELPDWLEICKESSELRLKPGYTIPKQTRKATPKNTPNKCADKQEPQQDHKKTTKDLNALSSDQCKKKD